MIPGGLKKNRWRPIGWQNACLNSGGDLDAVAISGFFSIRNPAHETRVARELQRCTRLPVICGHSLSSRLGGIERATTAWWNARLVPLISRLIESTRSVIAEFGLDVPLMIVKGDGTLLSAAEARRRPVETLLSGPAASLIGARHLSGLQDALVVDMGGTTTDMAALTGGRVEVAAEGARVGPWQTHVEAARVRTVGLGGDSLFRSPDATLDRLSVGPRRVEPLCTLAERFPAVVETLARIDRKHRKRFPVCRRPVHVLPRGPVRSTTGPIGGSRGLPKRRSTNICSCPANRRPSCNGTWKNGKSPDTCCDRP